MGPKRDQERGPRIRLTTASKKRKKKERRESPVAPPGSGMKAFLGLQLGLNTKKTTRAQLLEAQGSKCFLPRFLVYKREHYLVPQEIEKEPNKCQLTLILFF